MFTHALGDLNEFWNLINSKFGYEVFSLMFIFASKMLILNADTRFYV